MDMKHSPQTINDRNRKGAVMTQYFTRTGIEIDPNGDDVRRVTRETANSKTVHRIVTCPKCNGSGTYHFFIYNADGKCFKCHGHGTVVRKDRVYTAEKNAHLDALAEKREAKQLAKINAENAKIEAQRAVVFEQFKTDNADLFAKYAKLDKANSFIADVMFKAWRNAELSQRQLESVEAAIDRALDEQAQSANAVDVIEGRIEITGVIVSTKHQFTAYGDQFKMLVLDDRGFKVWGTIPSSLMMPIDELRNERVTFTATVERSSDDSKFGFYKRPTKAALEAWAA
jgi:hypothetical protein